VYGVPMPLIMQVTGWKGSAHLHGSNGAGTARTLVLHSTMDLSRKAMFLSVLPVLCLEMDEVTRNVYASPGERFLNTRVVLQQPRMLFEPRLWLSSCARSLA
jgi:hypothetical protein